MLDKEQIFPSISTCVGSDWRAMLIEAKKIGIKKAGLLLNCLTLKERAEFYDLLSSSGINEIPLIHMRNDMTEMELEYFSNEYGTKIFAAHPSAEYPLFEAMPKFQKNIFIENTHTLFNEQELKRYGGICLNLSHLENERIGSKDRYDLFRQMIETYAIGCNFISAIKPQGQLVTEYKEYIRHDDYLLGEFSELDYLKNYPKEYFSGCIVLEMQNNLAAQIKAKDYIFDLLKNCW
ncbi:MAG: hypothetical protein WCX77_03160 [Candidatus Paceibacterota bacterium]|jgi:hypothetical protein